MADMTLPHRGPIDVLRVPLIGRFLRWRRGRLVMQVALFAIALLLVIDGFTGPQNAARNLATVTSWVHYRGLLVVVLLVAGNLFCMACPFALPRSAARRLSIRGKRFPRALRNKWLAIGGLFLLFFLYELLDLWASPLLTAWVIVAYFVASFVLEALFTESAFCKYVCPLGSFNYVYSTLSPTQIGVRDPDICARCVGKECVNGSYAPQPVIRVDDIGGGQTREVKHGPDGVLGCGTLLFAPQVKSNLDCTMCLDCVRACPYDNAGLMLRPHGRELSEPGSWPGRWDVSLLVVILAFTGMTNAFGMVPPVYALLEWLANTLYLRSEAVALLILFGVGNLLLPVALTLLAGWASRALAGAAGRLSLREVVAAFAPAFVPLGFGVWFAHYAFHFLIAPLTIIPVLQEFFGMPGEWTRFGAAADTTVISLVQVVVLAGGFFWSLLLAQRAAMRLYKRNGMPGLMPWALLLLGMMLVTWWIMSLPMEMRGTDLFA